jgi:hypothetical protein
VVTTSVTCRINAALRVLSETFTGSVRISLEANQNRNTLDSNIFDDLSQHFAFFFARDDSR